MLTNLCWYKRKTLCYWSKRELSWVELNWVPIEFLDFSSGFAIWVLHFCFLQLQLLALNGLGFKWRVHDSTYGLLWTRMFLIWALMVNFSSFCFIWFACLPSIDLLAFLVSRYFVLCCLADFYAFIAGSSFWFAVFGNYEFLRELMEKWRCTWTILNWICVKDNF